MADGTNVIRELTKDCQRRTECRIVRRYSVKTLVAWHPTYDADGNRLDRGDPNTTMTEYECWTCGAQWSVSVQFDEIKTINKSTK